MYAGEIVEAEPTDGAVPHAAAPVHAAALRGHAGSVRRRRGRLDPGNAAPARPRRSSAVRSAPAATGPSTAARVERRRCSPSRTGMRRRATSTTSRQQSRGVSVAASGNGEAPLLEVEGLVTRYPVPRGPSARSRAPRSAKSTPSTGSPSRSPRARCSRSSASREAGRRRPRSRSSGSWTPTPARSASRERTSRRSRKQLRGLRRRIQIIYQDPYESLDPRFRVHETVEEPLLIHGEGAKRRAAARGRATRYAGRGLDAAGALPRPLPARALGRPAPTRRHRRKPRARSTAARRR